MGQPQASRDARRLVSLTEAAKHAGCHTATLGRRIRDGSLTAYKFGPRLVRIDLDELDAMLAPMPACPQAHVSPLDSAVARVVAEAPALTPEQRDKLAVLLGGAR